MKRFLLIVWANLLRRCGALRWAKNQLRYSGAIVVLTFHRVLDPGSCRATCSLDGIVVQENTFAELCHYLAGTCNLADAGLAQPGLVHSKLTVTVTFDDGWRDNYTTALPILQKHKVPATIFICPGLAGASLPFWPERMVGLLKATRPGISASQLETVVESWKHRPEAERNSFLAAMDAKTPAIVHEQSAATDRLFTAAEAVDLVLSGVRLGSHTHRHELLTMVTPEVARRELSLSREAIETETASECTAFAYPNGDWSAATRQAVADAGFVRAFTTEIGAWTPGCDPLAIPRVNIYEGKLRGWGKHFSPAVFEYTVFWRAWRASRNARNHNSIDTKETGRPALEMERI